jgi:hypothetical protein
LLNMTLENGNHASRVLLALLMGLTRFDGFDVPRLACRDWCSPGSGRCKTFARTRATMTTAKSNVTNANVARKGITRMSLGIEVYPCR